MLSTHCVLSAPQFWDGSGLATPTISDQNFQFSQSDCISTESATTTNSVVDIAPDSALAVGISDLTYSGFLVAVCLLFVAGYFFGLSIYKR